LKFDAFTVVALTTPVLTEEEVTAPLVVTEVAEIEPVAVRLPALKLSTSSVVACSVPVVTEVGVIVVEFAPFVTESDEVLTLFVASELPLNVLAYTVPVVTELGPTMVVLAPFDTETPVAETVVEALPDEAVTPEPCRTVVLPAASVPITCPL